MDEPTRRAWSRPELIVLVRSGPEEAVLGFCKTYPRWEKPGPDVDLDSCHALVPYNCAACSEQADS